MRVAVILILVACGGAAERRVEPLSSRTAAPAQGPGPTVPIEWTPVRWTGLGLGFASFRGVRVDRTPWKVGGAAMQGLQRGDDERVRWLLRTAPDESLDGFRADHQGWAFAAGPTVSVCGQDVATLVATHAAEDIVCVVTAEGNHPAWIPPRRAVAIQFTNRGMPVVASFEIQSRTIEGWRDLEAGFFASLQCL
jgi:hypothetical protein